VKRAPRTVVAAVILAVLALAFVGYLYFFPESAVVTVKYLGPVTNQSNRAAFRITNVHRRGIHFSYATEARLPSGWPMDSFQTGSPWPLPALSDPLAARKSAVVTVPVHSARPWRLIVAYDKETSRFDEAAFKAKQFFYRIGWDWVGNAIPSSKFQTWVVASPAVETVADDPSALR
jgi:hypothetical protein